VIEMDDPDGMNRSSLPWRRVCSASSCVEVATAGNEVYVRNSQAPEGPMVAFSREEWSAFLGGVKGGAFDD